MKVSCVQTWCNVQAIVWYGMSDIVWAIWYDRRCLNDIVWYGMCDIVWAVLCTRYCVTLCERYCLNDIVWYGMSDIVYATVCDMVWAILYERYCARYWCILCKADNDSSSKSPIEESSNNYSNGSYSIRKRRCQCKQNVTSSERKLI